VGGLNSRESAFCLRRPLLALGLACCTPLLAADEVAPAEAELLMFLAEFADAEGEVPELGLLEQAGEVEPDHQAMNAPPPEVTPAVSTTMPPAPESGAPASRHTHEERPRLRGRTEHETD
jgi:hypothetical protein